MANEKVITNCSSNVVVVIVVVVVVLTLRQDKDLRQETEKDS